MLPEPQVLSPRPPRQHPGVTIIRRCVIKEPSRIKTNIDLGCIPLVALTPHYAISQQASRGVRVTLDVDISLAEAYTCCREYHIQQEPFVTYEESDLDWLLYCGKAKEIKQSILNADTIPISVVFTNNGQQHTLRTKLIDTALYVKSTERIKRHINEQTVTIPLLVIPDPH